MDNGQAQPTSPALVIAPKSFGEAFKVLIGNTRTVITHQKGHLPLLHLHRQLHRRRATGMTQSVVEQVAQGGDRQWRRHAQIGLRGVRRQMQIDTLRITQTSVLNCLARDLLGAALHTVLKRQTALDPCQQQQLLKRSVQAVGTLLSVFQGLLTDLALGHTGHL
ncbi:hypothetical protein D3C78_588900 [compost metagenome]